MFPKRTAWKTLPFLVALGLGALAREAFADEAPRRPRSSQPRLLVVLIGGIDSDPTSEQISGAALRRQGNSGLYQLRGDLLREPRVSVEYFNWNGTPAGEINAKPAPNSRGIAEFIHRHIQAHPRDKLALVGNSWGGHTAFEVSQVLYQHEAPVAIDLAVFLDPSSAARGPARPEKLPENLNRVVCYHTRNVFIWGRLPDSPRLTNIDLGDPANGFMRDGQPAYDARFDFRAHVAAEWDETIHADIKRRLLDIRPND
ncbi:MAG: hypothetical protein ACT4QC_01005 [Planctomycetaceae bacterium]